jgi:hypothetical protein
MCFGLNKLKYPSNISAFNYPMPVPIYNKPGAVVMAPQNAEGPEVLEGT